MWGRKKSRDEDFTLGMLVGGIIGALATLILIPKSSKRAHKKIEKQLEEISDQSFDLFEKTQEIEERLSSCCKRKLD